MGFDGVKGSMVSLKCFCSAGYSSLKMEKRFANFVPAANVLPA